MISAHLFSGWASRLMTGDSFSSAIKHFDIVVSSSGDCLNDVLNELGKDNN